MALMARTPDKYYDLAIVDPPYFDGPQKLGYFGEGYSSIGVTREEYEEIGDWGVPGEEYFHELFRVSKNQIIWGVNYYNFIMPGSGRIVWDKVNGKSSFSDCEIAYCSLINSVRQVRFMWNGMQQGCDFNGRMQGNKKLNEKRIHPTQKPVALYEWQLEKFTKEEDRDNPDFIVLDTHNGSGSSCIACHNYKIQIDACEKERKHYDKAVQRINKHVSQIKLF